MTIILKKLKIHQENQVSMIIVLLIERIMKIVINLIIGKFLEILIHLQIFKSLV